MVEKQFIINGGKELEGEINISGSKNATIACLAATLLTDDSIILENVPVIRDIEIMKEILLKLGIKIKLNHSSNKLTISSTNPTSEVPSELSKQIRGSTLFMGALLSRTGHCKIYNFGGCPIGQRPIDLHLQAFNLLGAKITQNQDFIEIFAKKLIGNEIKLKFPSVGATENAIIAAALAEGTSFIKNAAIEPEIINLIEFLIKMGLEIKFDTGKRYIKIVGTKKLVGTQHKIIPDRIEAGTYAIAATITKGDIILKNINVDHLKNIISTLKEMGIIITILSKSKIQILSTKRPLKPINIQTNIYPGFPTDMQPQLTSLATQSEGTSRIVESIYSNRFHHIPELIKMGSNIQIYGREIIIKGKSKLNGATLEAKDIRGGASLIIAALCAEGPTYIQNINQIFRGYEKIDQKLKSIGANLEVINKN